MEYFNLLSPTFAECKLNDTFWIPFVINTVTFDCFCYFDTFIKPDTYSGGQIV